MNKNLIFAMLFCTVFCLLFCTGCSKAEIEATETASEHIVLPNGVEADRTSSSYVSDDSIVVTVAIKTENNACISFVIATDVPSKEAEQDMAGITEEQWQQIFMDAIVNLM